MTEKELLEWLESIYCYRYETGYLQTAIEEKIKEMQKAVKG